MQPEAIGSRIPNLPDTSRQSAIKWLLDLGRAGLLMHQDDEPQMIEGRLGVETRGRDGRLFNVKECEAIRSGYARLEERYQDEVYDLMHGGPRFLVVPVGYTAMHVEAPVAMVVELETADVSKLRAYMEAVEVTPDLTLGEFDFPHAPITEASDYLNQILKEMEEGGHDMLLVKSSNGDIDGFGESRRVDCENVRVAPASGLHFACLDRHTGGMSESRSVNMDDLDKLWQRHMIGDPGPDEPAVQPPEANRASRPGL